MGIKYKLSKGEAMTYTLTIPRSPVPRDILEYINKVWDIKTLVSDDRYSKDRLRGIQDVLDTLNNLDTLQED